MPSSFTQKQFDDALADIIADHLRAGNARGRVVARDLHRVVVGGSNANRIPMACKAMWKLADKLPHAVVHRTPSGQSSTLDIDYHLDASAAQAYSSTRPESGRADPPGSQATTLGNVHRIVSAERPAHLPYADLYLVACAKRKRGTRAAARELYLSASFKKARDCVERTGRPWAILSARHGLLWPDDIVAPYEKKLAMGESRAWSEKALAALEPHLEGVSSVVFLAGAEYRHHLAAGLRERGIRVVVPMEGLRQGEQNAWLSACLAQSNAVTPSCLAEMLATDFYGDRLDLSSRGVVAESPWSQMPEVECARKLRELGATERSVRLFLTFVSAMDRARDAMRLWQAATELRKSHPEVFDPARASRMPPATLSALLSTARVSQRHQVDVEAWRTIACNLAGGSGAVCKVVDRGVGNAVELLADLRSLDRNGRPRFPLLRGAKIAPMWVRIIANPGGARVAAIDAIPVAVDVHVRRVTENLAVADTRALPLQAAKPAIQQAWCAAVAAACIGGPTGIADTCAALDPVLWFYGKHGCSHCERRGKRTPIGRACDHCRFVTVPPSRDGREGPR